MHHANIIQIGNSKGLRIPKELLSALGETTVTLHKTAEGILIKPAHRVPPLSEWGALFANADKTLDHDLKDWDETLADGLDNEAPYA